MSDFDQIKYLVLILFALVAFLYAKDSNNNKFPKR